MYCLIIATTAGTIALFAYGLTANANRAGQLVGAISFLAYVSGSVQMVIWMGKPWGSVAKDALDGLIYASISALTFMWLWP